MTSRRRLAALAATFTTLLPGCQQQPTPPAPAAAIQTASPAPPSTTDAQPAAEAPAKRKIDSIVQLESIGATKEFLERTLGLSTYETPDEATYKLDGCQVQLRVRDRAVEQVTIQLEPGCTFDAGGLTGQESTLVSGPITFSEFEELFGAAHYTAPCLRLCGNAYDPFVDAVVYGSRVNGVIDVSATAIFVEPAVIDASDVWENELVKLESEEWVGNTRFNCERQHNGVAQKAFSKVKVEHISFGRDLGTADCT